MYTKHDICSKCTYSYTYSDDPWSQEMQEIPNEQTKVTIPNLHSNENYDVRVYAEDENKRRGEPTTKKKTMTSKYSIIPFD